MKIITIRNFKLNKKFLNSVDINHLKTLTEMITHEKIHNKINKKFGLKSNIYINCKPMGEFYSLNGYCEPVGEMKERHFFTLDIIHFIFDILNDIFFHHSFKGIILDCIDFIIDLKRSFKVLINER